MSNPGPAVGRGPRRQRPDPRTDGEGRRIFTEDDLEGYFGVVPPAVLARDRRRRHRRHAVVLLVIAMLVAGVAVSAVQVLRGEWSIPGWEAAEPDPPLLCPAAEVTPGMESTVRVYNGTTIGGLAGDVANALEERGFTIGGVGNKGFTTSSMVAVIMSGPEGRETSLAVQRTIAGSVYLPVEREAGDDGVEIIMGTKYDGLVLADNVSAEPGVLDCQRLATEGAEPAASTEPAASAEPTASTEPTEPAS